MRTWLSDYLTFEREWLFTQWLLLAVLIVGMAAFWSYLEGWSFGHSMILCAVTFLGSDLGSRIQRTLQQSLPPVALRRIAAVPKWLRFLLSIPTSLFFAGPVVGILHSQGRPEWVVTCAMIGVVVVVGNLFNGYPGWRTSPAPPEDRPLA